jgi:hypothetical protein
VAVVPSVSVFPEHQLIFINLFPSFRFHGVHSWAVRCSSLSSELAKSLANSSDDFNRFADVTGDDGWSWDNVQPYIRKVRPYTPFFAYINLSAVEIE